MGLRLFFLANFPGLRLFQTLEYQFSFGGSTQHLRPLRYSIQYIFDNTFQIVAASVSHWQPKGESSCKVPRNSATYQRQQSRHTWTKPVLNLQEERTFRNLTGVAVQHPYICPVLTQNKYPLMQFLILSFFLQMVGTIMLMNPERYTMIQSDAKSNKAGALLPVNNMMTLSRFFQVGFL